MGAPHGGCRQQRQPWRMRLAIELAPGSSQPMAFDPTAVAVALPLVRTTPYQTAPRDAAKRRSVCGKFKQTVRDIAGDEIDFYLEYCSQVSRDGAEPLQVASSGFSLEELKIIKQSYLEIRDRLIGTHSLQRLPMSISPLEVLAGTHQQSGITGSF